MAKEWSPAFNSLTMRGLGNNHANALAEEEDIEHEIEPVKDALRFDLRRVQVCLRRLYHFDYPFAE